eukprot:TRINITY_DN37888_c0_g2_i2.p1 TRINITY_DN37888_c0_g2~~TRINITY_DN37888_c0_g2_i2.p1  ORF type:complete len:389 (-),score=71.92 TRINITY_DN37888_c0_g2_i2:138-1304(-)
MSVTSIRCIVDLSCFMVLFFFFQAEDGIRDAQESRGLGDVYKRQFRPTGLASGFGAPKMVITRSASSSRSPSATRPLTPRVTMPSNSGLAIRIAQDVSKRPNEIAQRVEEAKVAKVKRMLDMRYNMVVEDSLDDEGSTLMKRVPKSGLRVEYYARNRKKTVHDLHTRRRVPAQKVRMVAAKQATGACVCGPLTANIIEFIVGCVGDNEEALHRLGMTSIPFSESVQAKLVERNVQVNAAFRARAALTKGRKDVERIPRSYFKAIQAVKGELPGRVSFVLALVVLLLEKSARLSANPVARNPQTAEVFRSYLAVGSIEDTVGLITSLDPQSVPHDTVEAVISTVGKGMREFGAPTEAQLLVAMRSYNEHTESLLGWVLAIVAYHRELSS